MKAAHRVYERARETFLAAQLALKDAAAAKGIVPGPLPSDPDYEDPLAGEREAVRLASEALRAAEAPIADEIEAAWQRNLDKVQAAKAACRAAITAALVVEKEVAEAVAKRRLHPQPAGSPLITEVEQDRLKAANQALDDAIEANRQAEVRLKVGVTAEDLEAVG